jgi:hypothetical protein
VHTGSAVPVKVQVESLNALTSLCLALPRAESSERNGMQGINAMQLQLTLPCILVALSSAVQVSAFYSREVSNNIYSYYIFIWT